MSAPSLESPWADAWPSARRELAFRDDARGFSLLLKRNCSITPAGLARVFVALAVAVLAIGTGFALAGAWLILPFAGLEVLLLGAAFVFQARHAADYERIELEGGRLRIEVGEAQHVTRYEVSARELQVEADARHVWLRGARERLQLGRHLDAQARAAFAAELARRLRI